MYHEYSFVVDIDGTLCPIKGEGELYQDLVPYAGIVEKLREYKKNGAKVILFTSRNMNTYSGNIGAINKYTAKILLEWLDRWEIPYDEIIYGKPWPGQKGFYIDDRTVRPDEFLKYSLEELTELCENSKIRKELEEH